MPLGPSASIAPITAFQMPSADDLGFYTKKRLNLYDANIEGIGSHASRVSIAAHTDTNLVDATALTGVSTAVELEDAKKSRSMNSLRLTSAIAAPSSDLETTMYQAPVISNLKDPIDYILNPDSTSALPATELEFLRRPIVDGLMDSVTPLVAAGASSAAVSDFELIDNCAASVLTVKKMIAVAMEGEEALTPQQGGAAYYSQSVRELLDQNARQALVFKGSFEAMDLSEIRSLSGSGGIVNGNVYVVTKNHTDVLKGLHTPLNTSSTTDDDAATLLPANYEEGAVLSPFFVKFNDDDPNIRVAESVYSDANRNRGSYTVYSTANALQASELVGVAASITQTNTDGDDASYVFGNVFEGFTLHKGDLVMIQQADHDGSDSSGSIKFSFIQRNVPDEHIASEEFVTEQVETSEEYLKMKINDTGTNLLYLSGLMSIPTKDNGAGGAAARVATTYQLDPDEENIKGLLQGTHSDVRDRFGQQITKARFLYTLTDFGSSTPRNSGSYDTGVDSEQINDNPELTGLALWTNLVNRSQAKLGNDTDLADLILPHDDNQYHNLTLTCAYLQHQVNVLGRQLYLLADNDEGFVDTTSGRQEILSNFIEGGGNELGDNLVGDEVDSDGGMEDP